MVITALLSGDIESDTLSQWDTGVRIRLSGCVLSAVYVVDYSIDGNYVHTEVDPVQIDFTSSSLYFCLPDVYLQRAGALNVRVSCTVSGVFSTVFSQNFVISARDKPLGYCYTPMQQHSFAALASRVAALERQGNAAYVSQTAAEVKAILEQVRGYADDCKTIRDSLSDTLSAIRSVLDDVNHLESNIARAVSASQDAGDAYAKIDAVRAEMRRIADSAEGFASAAEASSQSASTFVRKVQGYEASCRAVLLNVNAVQGEVQSSSSAAAESAVSARDAAAAAKAAADRINVAGFFIKVKSCTYNKTGAYTNVKFSDYGLTFDAPPVVIPGNPFSSYTGTVVAYDITTTGFRLYLQHGTNTGTIDVSVFVGSLKEDVGGGS